MYRTAGCRLRGEGHEVDLLLHEGMDDPTSTRGEMSQKKGVPLTTDAINNSGFGSFGWPVLGGCGGGERDRNQSRIRDPKVMWKGEARQPSSCKNYKKRKRRREKDV